MYLILPFTFFLSFRSVYYLPFLEKKKGKIVARKGKERRKVKGKGGEEEKVGIKRRVSSARVWFCTDRIEPRISWTYGGRACSLRGRSVSSVFTSRTKARHVGRHSVCIRPVTAGLFNPEESICRLPSPRLAASFYRN